MLNREDSRTAIPQLEKMIKEVGNNVVDGKTSYLHIAYANNSTGTDGFSTTYSIAKSYLGQYSDFEEEASTIPSKYSWTLIKGDTGATGPSGTVISDTAPTDTGQLWLDTSGETDVLKENDGTSWAEIPVETKAVEAAKTATDFLEDSAGTTVIKNTSPSSNAKAVVGENSFDIIKDGDTVATFGELAQVGGSLDNVRINPGGIQFTINNTAAAYVSADKMYAQNIETAGALYFKHYSIKEDTDGKLVIYKR